MGVNKHKAHVLVIPEDGANRQLANGFALVPGLNSTCIDVRPEAGGWPKVLSDFKSVHEAGLRKYPLRHLVLLIDFDDAVEERTRRFKTEFPPDVADRVYLLGARSEPEPLRKACGLSLERIGTGLANTCVDGTPGLWEHDLLVHNQSELDRLTASVKPFLFR